jgi:hypothetical protein
MPPIARILPRSRSFHAHAAGGLAAVGLLLLPGCDNTFGDDGSSGNPRVQDPVVANADALIEEGRRTFRYETFGDEAFWGDTLRLHEAIAGVALGGVGPGLSPTEALGLGLKVDSEALDGRLRSEILRGTVDLEDPATTVELLRREAVVGVKGFFDPTDALVSVGIQCALCHTTVDDSFQPGMGQRLDGWANRDLDVGSIIALAPNLAPVADLLGVDEATVRTALHAWGPGKFDAEIFLDGKAFRPQGGTAATLIPPAFGLGGINLHTWTGWGSITYWNAFVANVEMHGKGTFYDPRLEDALKFPVAAAANTGDIVPVAGEDLITPKLAALQFYQLALPIPVPPPGSFDGAAALAGEEVFRGAADCARCHVPPLYTEPGWNMHTAAEIGIDDFQALRSPDERYRTAPLRGLFTHTRGGFYHDGRFATLEAVVDHYDAHFTLGLTPLQKSDLIEFLKSL